MGAGVVTVGRLPYAVGLYWENSSGGRTAQAAKEAARQPGQQADFYAVRAGTSEGRVAQFGLAQAASGHKAGMPSFAGCIANQQVGSWGGAFRLREGTALIIVRDDLVVPDGDQFFADENDARDRLMQEIGFGGLQRIYAPEAWSIPGADSMPLSLLLDERRDIRLQRVEIPKKFILMAGGGGIALLIALGIGWYVQEQQAEEAAAALAKQEALRREQLAAKNLVPSILQPKVEAPKPEPRWEKKPLPMDVIQACRDGLKQLPAAVLGWRMTQMRCDGVEIVSLWARQNGYALPLPGAEISDTLTQASLRTHLPELPLRNHEDLVDEKEVTRRFLTQNWPGSLNRAPDDPPPPPPGYTGPWTPQPAPWVKRSFTLTVPELPSGLASIFDGLPGAVITFITLAPGNVSWTWTVEGVIYESRN
jgi:hypothetical protein